MPKTPMKAMILAAGLGTRLRPLTLERAKPAIPLLGKPLVVRLIESLMKSGIGEFRLNLHHLPRTIESIFDHDPWQKLPVYFSYEAEILGTAGGLKNNESFFIDNTFVMANGDIVMDFSLAEAIAFHHERQAMATLVLIPQQPPLTHYPIRIDHEGHLWNFKGTAPVGEPTDDVFAFTGIHILEPEIFDSIPQGRFWEINDEVYPGLLKSGKAIYGFPVEGYWNDLGDPKRYLQAQRDLFSQSGIHPSVQAAPEAQIDPRASVGPHVSIEAGCVVEANSSIEDAILWDQARVLSGASVRNAILGAGVVVQGSCHNRVVTRHGEIAIESL
ncbi:MAG: NDP-sugar synthase [Thermodesulfobacteriota bacterium]